MNLRLFLVIFGFVCSYSDSTIAKNDILINFILPVLE